MSTNYNIVVTLKFLTNFNLSPTVLLQYLLFKLDLLYIPREILPKIISRIFPKARFFFKKKAKKKGEFNLNLKRKPLAKGIMFKCAGRFSRAQMASYQVFKEGGVPLSTIAANVKYAFGTISLKYGSLGLKVFVVT